MALGREAGARWLTLATNGVHEVPFRSQMSGEPWECPGSRRSSVRAGHAAPGTAAALGGMAAVPATSLPCTSRRRRLPRDVAEGLLQCTGPTRVLATLLSPGRGGHRHPTPALWHGAGEAERPPRSLAPGRAAFAWGKGLRGCKLRSRNGARTWGYAVSGTVLKCSGRDCTPISRCRHPTSHTGPWGRESSGDLLAVSGPGS